MEHVSLPFVWPDVALVHMLCALPLAWLLATHISRRATVAGRLGLAACLLGMLAMLLFVPVAGVILRTATALLPMLAAALLWQSLSRRQRTANASTTASALAVSVALLLPWTYVAARVRHDVARFGELIELSRIGEARTLAHRLLALDAQANWRGALLSRLAADLDRAARELDQRVAVPLRAEATSDERLERARQLAMLGRTVEASDVLGSLEGPEAISLQAVIFENQGQWDAALLAYSKARAAWQSQPASEAQASGLISATRGVAYSQRKSGRYAEAEATYQQLLALAPTAESHFLLAQFYEDAQHAEHASRHARQAMSLAPDVYRQPGEQLIRKLRVYHFGCLGVPRAASD